MQAGAPDGQHSVQSMKYPAWFYNDAACSTASRGGTQSNCPFRALEVVAQKIGIDGDDGRA